MGTGAVGYVQYWVREMREALRNPKTACFNREIPEGLILHSDLGSQYTSNDYEKALEDLEIKHSFSKRGCSYDNTGIKSFHASFKEGRGVSKNINFL